MATRCTCKRLADIPWGNAIECPAHGEVWIPCCLGSIDDLDRCTCPEKPSLQDQVGQLSAKVAELAERLERCEGEAGR